MTKTTVEGLTVKCDRGCLATFADEETAKEWAKEHEERGHE